MQHNNFLRKFYYSFGQKYNKKGKIFKNYIKSIAFIDLLFLLLIFLLISFYFSPQVGHKLTLPNNQYADTFPASNITITIAPSFIKNSFFYYLEGEKLSLDEIEIKLAQKINKRQSILTKYEFDNRQLTLSLKVDKTVPYSYIASIFNLAKKYNLDLITQTEKK